MPTPFAIVFVRVVDRLGYAGGEAILKSRRWRDGALSGRTFQVFLAGVGGVHSLSSFCLPNNNALRRATCSRVPSWRVAASLR